MTYQRLKGPKPVTSLAAFLPLPNASSHPTNSCPLGDIPCLHPGTLLTTSPAPAALKRKTKLAGSAFKASATCTRPGRQPHPPPLPRRKWPLWPQRSAPSPATGLAFLWLYSGCPPTLSLGCPLWASLNHTPFKVLCYSQNVLLASPPQSSPRAPNTHEFAHPALLCIVNFLHKYLASLIPDGLCGEMDSHFMSLLPCRP